jgi:hypothetical protein
VVTLRDLAVRPDTQRSTAAALGASVVGVDGGHAMCVTDPGALGAGVREAVDLVAGARRVRWLARATDRRFSVGRSARRLEVASDPSDAETVGVAV